jgi:signal transduction histidine kinase
MYQNIGLSLSQNKWLKNTWLSKVFKRQFAKNLFAGVLPQSKTIPWFSIIGLSTATLFCIAFGAAVSHFMTHEILNHDAIITSQFINSVEWVETKQAQLEHKVRFGQLLDDRTNFEALGVDPSIAAEARSQYVDHISMLPDVKLANIYASDRSIIWSTNPDSIGQVKKGDANLEQVFTHKAMLSIDSFNGEKLKDEQFASEPGTPFVETYIPMTGMHGEVVAIVQIYQEPQSLAQTIHRGKLLIWLCIALGAAFLYITPFFIFRRADGELHEKQERLTEAETLCVIGEMSTAVAHGIRNPLASIRSSAELALDADPDSARKNAEDIISQVDRLGKWVREFLTYSLPVSGESEVMSAVSLVETCLLNFSTQLKKNNIVCDFERPSDDVPLIEGNRILANQALSSVVSNAIEAMPEGGSLRLKLEISSVTNCVDVVVVDSGIGMSANQIQLAFKPFYTTKRNGVGLGMAQVKRIMERFGGVASLHSREGEGTQACLSFRVA